MTNDDLHELVAAYALDALDATTAAAFESPPRRVRALPRRARGAERDRRRRSPSPSRAPRRLRRCASGSSPPRARSRRRWSRCGRGGRALYAGIALAAAACAALAIGLYAGLSGGGSSSKRLALTVEPTASPSSPSPGLTGGAGRQGLRDLGDRRAEPPQPAGLFAGGGKRSSADPAGAVGLDRRGHARARRRGPRPDAPDPPVDPADCLAPTAQLQRAVDGRSRPGRVGKLAGVKPTSLDHVALWVADRDRDRRLRDRAPRHARDRAHRALHARRLGRAARQADAVRGGGAARAGSARAHRSAGLRPRRGAGGAARRHADVFDVGEGCC